MDAAAQGTVEPAHPQLDEDGDHQNGAAEEGELGGLRVEDLLQGALTQFYTHQQDEQRDQKAGEILHAPVAKGVVRVRLLPRQPEAHQGDHRGGGVREVVEGVCGDGNGPGHQAGGELSRKEQQIEGNAHASGKYAVAAAHHGVLGLRIVGDKAVKNGVQQEKDLQS